MLICFDGLGARRSERDGVKTVDSPSQNRFDIGDGNLTRFGCPSLKTKLWIARVDLNMLRDTVAHEARASATAWSAA